MAYKEDSDIKIFGTPEPVIDDEFPRQIEELNHHRQNGNFAKAKQLAQKLYDLFMEDDSLIMDTEPEFQEGKMPVKSGVLVMFSAEAALNMYLPSTQLSAITVAELHQLFASVQSPIFEKVLESPAYSFYYLSLRKGGEEAIEDIGKAYAEHCRHEGDEKFIEHGKHIYNVVQKEVLKQINLMEFAD